MRFVLTIALITSACLGLCADVPSADALIKRTASLTLKVEKFSQTQSQLEALLGKASAEIKSAESFRTEKGRRHGWFIISVPKENLESLVAEIRALGKPTAEVWNKQLRGNEIAAIDARVARLIQHEQRMQGMLSNGRKLRANDMLFIHDRVFRTATDEDRLKLEKEALISDSMTSAIMLTAFERYLASETKTQQQGRLETFKMESQATALDAGKWFALTGLKVLLYLPAWLPLVLLGRWAWKKYLPAAP